MKQNLEINKLKKLASLLGIKNYKNLQQNILIDRIVFCLTLQNTPNIVDEYKLRYYSTNTKDEVTFLLQDLGVDKSYYNNLTKLYDKKLNDIKLEYLNTINSFYYKVSELNSKYLIDLNIQFDKILQ